MSTKPNPWLALLACRARSGTAEHLLFLTPSNKMLGSADVLPAALRCSWCRIDAWCSVSARAETIAQLRRLPGQPIQLCHGANGRAAVTAARSHLAPHRVPWLALLPASIPMGLSACTPWGFLQALSSLFFPGSLSCFLHPGGFSRPLDHSGLSFRRPSLPWVPLAGVSALDPFYSVSLQHPLARSPQFSSVLCQTVMPCQCIHRSMVWDYSDASISPAYLVALSSLAFVIVPLVWFRVLGRERGSRHWCGLDFAASDYRGLVLMAQTSLPSCHPAAGLAVVPCVWAGWCMGWGRATARSLLTVVFPSPSLGTILKVWIPYERRNKILVKTLTLGFGF